ncbi:spore germination protein [Paenibacillus mesophilus]|uniref:spore germination protein n=1 Tax=Paenibacillus mesophilus TaxID=2582849 RepID=UPI00110F2CDB|nr:spore germination protein [Paenibacillus mesophilus]TMV45522.1 spore germination protein [Paenibacillus mesophilus]
MSDSKHAKAEPWSEHRLRQLFDNSADVQIQAYRFADNNPGSFLLMIYSEGLCDSSQLGKIVLPELSRAYEKDGFKHLSHGHVHGVLPLISFGSDVSEEQIMDAVFQGDLVISFQETNILYKLNISNRPDRTPEESTTEISIKGPKDGFVEDLTINVALVRKRLRTNTLCCETSVLGRRTRTKIGLLYIRDIIAPEVLTEVRKRLDKIDIDGIYSISQLEEALSDIKYTLFPLLDFTGRPDYAVTSLLAGRFVIMIDGNPMVLIGPATFALILKSPEDVHFSFQYVSLTRLIRLVSFWLAILLPGFWVALSGFHQDQIPFRLMATISMARIGLPLSIQMEMFLLLLLLEIFREAGVRLPSSIGQTLTVVGGFIVGDAAIRAGLVSPAVVVVGSITAVSTATLVNQSMGTMISVIRLAIFIISSVIGMYGFILGLILVVYYMSKLKSFGVPYWSPLSPPIFKDMLRSHIRLPWSQMKSRPHVLNPIDPDHEGKDDQ